MEHQMHHLQSMNGDLLAKVMSHGDGLALAFIGCTCSDLRNMAKDQSLWKHLCHSTWPSTALAEAEHLVSSSVGDGFDKFYADSYPLILYDDGATNNSSKLPNCPKLEFHTSPSDFVSFVDVYWKNKCVLSRFLDSIPEAADVFELMPMDHSWGRTANERQRWFLNCPFKLELFQIQEENDNENGELSCPLAPVENMKSGDHCKELSENLRLSWVLVDKKTGNAVNLSSWKPLLIQKIWPFHGDYVMHFGCVIPVDEIVLPNKLAKCTITTRIKMRQTAELMQWREISMVIENITGAHVNTRNSLMILNQALKSRRSINHIKVEKGFQQFEKQRREIIQRRELRETIAVSLYTFIQITAFVILCYTLTF